jgi:LysM repeat protein
MNNPSPFVPQGSFEEQKNKGRARAKIAVFFVLAIHGIGLMALLMQGCRQEKPAPPEEQQPTNAAPATPDTTAPPVDTNPPPTQTTNPPAAPEVVTPPVPTPPAPEQQQPAASSDYTIVKGDTPAGIAKKNHVSTKELMAANPGLEPTKLKVGQKIHLPAAGASTAGAAGTASPTESPAAEQSYTVKSGDTLSKIATQHGTSIKALRAANHLKTDKIHVGDKLKIPAKAAKAQAATTPAQPTTPPPAGQ